MEMGDLVNGHLVAKTCEGVGQLAGVGDDVLGRLLKALLGALGGLLDLCILLAGVGEACR